MRIKGNLIDIVKKNAVLYSVYYYFVSASINIIKMFVKTDDKLILFVSYGGRYYNDSPKCLYEAMQRDKRFLNYKYVWAFREPDKVEIPGDGRKIKIDTFDYYITALKARVWITNVMIERALRFKGKKVFYLHTTHTTLPKKMALDSENGKDFKTKNKLQYDCSCAQSELEAEMQLSMFGLKRSQILLSGYPKSDVLARAGLTEYQEAKKRLKIPKEKKVILYAPTYREENPNTMISSVDFNKWEKILGDEYFVLYRGHPTVSDMTKISASSSFIKNVSDYKDNIDIMLASDILVSDYSGIFFEYAVTEKPMYCYAFDYDDYIKSRELYFDIREMIPGGKLSEEELLQKIKMGLSETDRQLLNDFRKKYVSIYGNATKICLDKIIKSIGAEN